MNNELIVNKLKELINSNGPDCLASAPYEVYKALIEAQTRSDGSSVTAGNSAADKKTAAMLLYVLITCPQGSYDAASIQSACSLNKKAAESIADIFSSLYSAENMAAWENNSFVGLHDFLAGELKISWTGEATWYPDGVEPSQHRSYSHYGYRKSYGEILEEVCVSCSYEAEIVLKPNSLFSTLEEDIKQNKKNNRKDNGTKGSLLLEELQEILRKNPYTTKEEINEFFTNTLCAHLDCEFEDFCTGDEYYPPVAEDFGTEYYVKKWAQENGFDVIKCEGEGSSV